MSQCRLEPKIFSSFECSRYASDVTFHQTDSSTGNVSEGKVHFFERRKMDGHREKVSVLSSGLTIDCTAHYPGSVADVEKFREKYALNEEALKTVIP